MIIEISKAKSIKALFEFISEELTAEEYHKLLVKLIRNYNDWQGADMESLARLCVNSQLYRNIEEDSE